MVLAYIAIILFIILILIVLYMWYETTECKYIEYEDDVEIISRHKPDGKDYDDYTVVVKYHLMKDIDVLTGKENYLISTMCSYDNKALAKIRRIKYRNGEIGYMVASFCNQNLNRIVKQSSEESEDFL